MEVLFFLAGGILMPVYIVVRLIGGLFGWFDDETLNPYEARQLLQ